jgi:hypothetical protein
MHAVLGTVQQLHVMIPASRRLMSAAAFSCCTAGEMKSDSETGLEAAAVQQTESSSGRVQQKY